MSVGLFLSLLTLSLVWGSYYVANRVSLQYLSPFFVGLVVRAVTFLLLIILMTFKRQVKELFKVKGILSKLLLIGVLGFSLDITAFIGLRLSSAANGAVLLKADVLFANLITIFFLKERFSYRDWLYTGGVLLGVGLVVNIDLVNFRFEGIGDIFFLLSAFFVSLNAFVIKSVQLDRVNPASDNVVAFYNNFITMGIFAIIFFLSDKGASLPTVRENSFLVLPLLYAGAMQTFIYLLYYFNLRRLPVWLVKITLLMMPVFATIISFLLLKEGLKLIQVLGMIIVLMCTAGIIIEQKRKKELKAT
ncbi:DMT family transporter [Mesotoga sp. B105.6.4]|uniref:DMT family transporter n=1 Tax=Mesotoga sp. B105.6.4 TaxID=1582224 RepID=UPI000CCC1E46|nr:DMT family transporter [Mesotoga sp. B105.6.4]PNS40949.1 membrane protein [Mesotoga sp. B105.6.4]RAM59723.1 membrane protein [Mesotoga sp. SC_4PWA21]